MEIEAEQFTLKVSLTELNSIADGLRTVLPRYDMPNNPYYQGICEMLRKIDQVRGITE